MSNAVEGVKLKVQPVHPEESPKPRTNVVVLRREGTKFSSSDSRVTTIGACRCDRREVSPLREATTSRSEVEEEASPRSGRNDSGVLFFLIEIF